MSLKVLIPASSYSEQFREVICGEIDSVVFVSAANNHRGFDVRRAISNLKNAIKVATVLVPDIYIPKFIESSGLLGKSIGLGTTVEYVIGGSNNFYERSAKAIERYRLPTTDEALKTFIKLMKEEHYDCYLRDIPSYTEKQLRKSTSSRGKK